MENPTFKLEGVVKVKENMEDFEGPLNLILTLLSKNKIEIKDIQISSLLEQYLEYIENMKSMDLEVASEFVAMASHLVYIKARTVLKSSEEKEVDELEELKSSLEALKNKDKYVQIKQVADWLEEMYKNGSGLLVRKAETLPAQRAYAYQHETQDLLDALERAFTETNQAPPTPDKKQFIPNRIVFSVSRKTAEILAHLREVGVISLDELMGLSESRSELVATFISVLELCKSGSVVVFGEEDDLSIALGENVDKGEVPVDDGE
ncbi:MAG: chromosome segregation protein ScpA [Ruminococcaceae bacterium]|nr:chromosome segregation protein ScpA [Oscillospiraceae bacterium]